MENKTTNITNLPSNITVYNIRLEDDIINVNTSLNAITLYLPNIKNSGLKGNEKEFFINDISSNASVNNITIIGVSGDLVNGGASTLIDNDKGSAICDVCNDNEWLISKNTDGTPSIPTLEEVLIKGQNTGANNIVVDNTQFVVYNSGDFSTSFGTNTLTDNRVILLPNSSGTVALTSQITGNGIFDNSNNGASTPTAFNVGITNTLTFGSDLLFLNETSKRVGFNNASPESSFHIKAYDNLGTYIDGNDDVSSNRYILSLRNSIGTVYSRFNNRGDTELSMNGRNTYMGDISSNYLHQSVQTTTQFSNTATYTGFHANRDGSGISMRAHVAGRQYIDSTGDMIFGTGWNNNAGGTTGVEAMRIGGTTQNVSIGSTTITGQRFLVRGEGSTSATTLVRFESLDNSDRFIQNDEGQIGTGVNINGYINSGLGQFHQSNGYGIGYGFYGLGACTTTLSVQHKGTNANPIALDIAFQSNSTGFVIGGRALSWSNASTTNIGFQGSARNASQYSIGVEGVNAGGATVESSGYVAGVRGSSNSNLHVTSYGGHFTSGQATSTTYTKDIHGIYGSARENDLSNSSTGRVIGGKFLTTTSGGGTSINKHMAINVPFNGNDGVVVFGADDANGNSMLQVTGDIQTFGSANGLIVEDRTDTNRYRIYTEAGVLKTEIVV